ncbi:Uncharacterized protein HZ326_11796 [Fusarium oxysporum f. sp. albedinis]|nr:Uncharacterized protein HZ326_11796 [Fusarium oxysporum f. sp. albedinis]
MSTAFCTTAPVLIRVVTGYGTRTCLHARHSKRQLQRWEVPIALTRVFPTTIRSPKPHPFPFVPAPFTAHFFRNLEDCK